MLEVPRKQFRIRRGIWFSYSVFYSLPVYILLYTTCQYYINNRELKKRKNIQSIKSWKSSYLDFEMNVSIYLLIQNSTVYCNAYECLTDFLHYII